jgi:diguanylate cyclase (GGDEF)-like protein
LLGKGHWSGEVWNRRKDGQVYAVFETISAIRDSQGQTAHFVATLSDITGFKTTEQRLEHLAHFDALTALPNRLLLGDRLQQTLATSARRHTHVAVCFLDLDGFKSINDRFGHDTGDLFLVHIALRLREVVREGDTLARLGGDEFVVVLTDLQEREQVLPLLERLLNSAATATTVNGHDMAVSASIGVTFYPQQDTTVTPDALIQQADGAMYRAKTHGKNACCFADECQDAQTPLPSFYRMRADVAAPPEATGALTGAR